MTCEKERTCLLCLQVFSYYWEAKNCAYKHLKQSKPSTWHFDQDLGKFLCPAMPDCENVFSKKAELENHIRATHRKDLSLMLGNGYLIKQAFANDVFLSKKASALQEKIEKKIIDKYTATNSQATQGGIEARRQAKRNLKTKTAASK